MYLDLKHAFGTRSSHLDQYSLQDVSEQRFANCNDHLRHYLTLLISTRIAQDIA